MTKNLNQHRNLKQFHKKSIYSRRVGYLLTKTILKFSHQIKYNVQFLSSATLFLEGSAQIFSSPERIVKWMQVKITNMILQRPFNDDTFILFFLSWKDRWKVQVFNQKDILVSCDKNQLKKYILQVILNWKHNFICRIYRGITVQLIDDLKLQKIFELEMTRSDIFRSIRFENTGLNFLFKYCSISHTYLHSIQHILI